MGWKTEARKALYQYPRLKRAQADLTAQQITPVYGGTAVQHGASRVTENVALRSPLTEREESIISAVEFAMRMQSRYYNAEARLKMMQLVFFRQTHTLQGAALECGYNINTIKAWSNEVLTAVYVAIKKE